MPPDLAGRLEIEVVRCERHPGDPGMRVAEVELRTGPTDVRIPGLHCGATAPDGRVLYPHRVPVAERMEARSVRRLRAVFPADARHTGCACAIDAVMRLPPRPDPSAPPRAEPSARAGPAPGERPTGARPAPGEPLRPGPPVAPAARRPEPTAPEGAAPGRPGLGAWIDLGAGDAGPEEALRRERVLPPRVTVRRERAGGPAAGALAAGDEVDVVGIDGGWKLVRSRTSGLEGWIPADAATPDLEAPARLAWTLGRLAPHLDASGTRARDATALCAAVDEPELGDLVFALLPELHEVYVTGLWHALSPRDRDAFQVWSLECFGVRRIVDVSTRHALRDLAWGEGPGQTAVAPAADPGRGPAPAAAEFDEGPAEAAAPVPSAPAPPGADRAEPTERSP